MGKVLKNIHAFLIFALTVAIVIFRIHQIVNYTNTSGEIIKGAESTIIIFWVLFALTLLLIVFNALRAKGARNPLTGKSSPLGVTALLSAVAMFFEFVFRVITTFNYVTTNSYVALNRLIPLILVAVAALVSAFYFVVVAISFFSPNYSFLELKYFHFAPLLWVVFAIITCLTENISIVYDEENVLCYVALIFAAAFFALFILAVDGKDENERALKFLALFSALYGATVAVLFLPRLVAFALGSDFGYTSFSTVPFFFTGVFAMQISVNVFSQRGKG